MHTDPDVGGGRYTGMSLGILLLYSLVMGVPYKHDKITLAHQKAIGILKINK